MPSLSFPRTPVPFRWYKDDVCSLGLADQLTPSCRDQNRRRTARQLYRWLWTLLWRLRTRLYLWISRLDPSTYLRRKDAEQRIKHCKQGPGKSMAHAISWSWSSQTLYASCSPLCARGAGSRSISSTSQRSWLFSRRLSKLRGLKVDADYNDKDKADTIGIPFNTIALFPSALFIQPETTELDACAPHEGDAGWPVCPCLWCLFSWSMGQTMYWKIAPPPLPGISANVSRGKTWKGEVKKAKIWMKQGKEDI